jgi:hypothetical protein
MGIYINPQDRTSKEEFLNAHAIALTEEEFRQHVNSSDYEQYFALVWINNGYFTAVAVAYCPREAADLTLPNDLREKRYYLIETDVLLTSNVLRKDELKYLQN